MEHSPSSSTPLKPLRSGISALAKSKMFFFAAAGISYALSIYLWFSGERERGLFVGIWVPSILSAGALLLAGARDE